MKVALVHDFLAQNGGAEKVLEVLQEMFPDAPTYTLVYDSKRMAGVFDHKDIRTSFLQKMPFGLKKYQWYLPFMPLATESYDLSGYDLVISSSSAFAKGIITQPGTKHICYCHTPTRYLWTDTHSYVDNLGYPGFMKNLIRMLLSKLRIWDRLAADRVDHFIANSHHVKERITKYYQRDSEVIYPPIELSKFQPIQNPTRDYFLTGGRLVSYKRFDITIKAFNRLGIPLKVFGTGPELEALKKMAKPHIEFLGYVSTEEKIKLFQNAKAFINPQVEDLGITPIEAMSCGTPVIAYGEGGVVETVIDGKTGHLFKHQRWEEIADIVIRFKDEHFDPSKLHEHAQQFGVEIFKNKIKNFVKSVM